MFGYDVFIIFLTVEQMFGYDVFIIFLTQIKI